MVILFILMIMQESEANTWRRGSPGKSGCQITQNALDNNSIDLYSVFGHNRYRQVYTCSTGGEQCLNYLNLLSWLSK